MVNLKLDGGLSRKAQFKLFFLLFIFNHIPPSPLLDKLRRRVLKRFHFKIEKDCIIRSPIQIIPRITSQISIGNSFISSNCRFSIPQGSFLEIGNEVLIGPNVSFEAVDHNLLYVKGKSRGANTKGIVIKDGVWIGCNVIILKGVEIGEGAVVAAGSVVCKSIPEYTLFGGVPAKFIKKIK